MLFFSYFAWLPAILTAMLTKNLSMTVNMNFVFKGDTSFETAVHRKKSSKLKIV